MSTSAGRACLYSPQLLSVMLQNGCICHNLQLVCQLLRTSRVLRAAVLQQCSSRVHLTFHIQTVNEAAVICSWIMKYGSLLGSLDLKFWCWRGPERAAAAARVACSLQAATSSLLGLQLRRVDLMYVDRDITGLLLQQLPVKHITSVALLIENRNPDGDSDCDSEDSNLKIQSEPGIATVTSALAGLRGLRHLSLAHVGPARHNIRSPDSLQAFLPIDPYATVLPVLTALTNLELTHCSKEQLVHLQQLQNLKELRLYGANQSSAGQMNLGQLTALTALHFYCEADLGPEADLLVLQERDVLPDSLQLLRIANCRKAAALSNLARLTSLTVSAATSTQLLTIVLRQLPSLQSMTLCYAPVKVVRVEVAPSADEDRLKGAAKELRYLEIKKLPILELPNSASATARVVQQLTALESLVLKGTGAQHRYWDRDQDEFDQYAVQLLVVAAAQLPNMKELTLANIYLDSSSAGVLAHAASRQLTSLTLDHTDLFEIDLSIICCGLTGLHRLCIQGDRDLFLDGLLPFIVKVMPSLSELNCGELTDYFCEAGTEYLAKIRERRLRRV